MAKRKLTTIFCADVDGYTNLMAKDEEATLARLQRSRVLMRDLFERHDGREINTWGDAVIAEFGSVVEAVRCAVAFQDALDSENISAKSNAMRFRIGVNLGDVIDDGNSVYGDGVNAAARLESVCEPGDVLVSDTVHSLVNKQLAIRFEAQAPRETKPGEDPVGGYKVTRVRKNAPPEADSETGERANSNSTLSKASNTIGRLDGWIMRQPRKVQMSCGLVVMFFTINLLFGGLSNPWFLFPSIPFLIHIYLNRDGGKNNAPGPE